MTYYETIKKWVKENYGESEIENPSWDIKKLANEVWRKRPTAELEEVIENWIDAETQSEIENHPEDYEKYYCDYGYIDTGVGMRSCGGEWEYDEEKAREVVLDELDEREILENDEVRQAFLKWIKNVM